MKRLVVLVVLSVVQLSVAARSATVVPETQMPQTTQYIPCTPDPNMPVGNETVVVSVSGGLLQGKYVFPLPPAGQEFEPNTLGGAVMSHGFGPTASYRNLEGEATNLARSCVVTLIHDYRGHGESRATTPQRQAPRWRMLRPENQPPKRSSHAMAYDSDRGEAVMFGGYRDGFTLEDTWTFSSQARNWTPHAVAGPPPRAGHVMVYDEARQVTVLFAGYDVDTGTLYNDLWLWSSETETWTEIPVSNAPPPRRFAAATYDTQRQVMVLSGGHAPGIGYYDDLWFWDGFSWQEQAAVGPSARGGSFMAYDSQRSVHVLFGGGDGYNHYKDTWELTPEGQWQNVTPPQYPSRRERGGAVYLPQIRRIFIYGGLPGYYDDSLAWNGFSWATREFNPSPPGRCCTTMVYDPVQKGVLVFGGSVSWIEHNDTWLFGTNP